MLQTYEPDEPSSDKWILTLKWSIGKAAIKELGINCQNAFGKWVDNRNKPLTY